MTVKVVILNWNGAGVLPRFLPSVVANTPPEVGIVVADNGSTDDSVEMLRRDFPSVRVVCLDRNYGFAGGYNRALAMLRAEDTAKVYGGKVEGGGGAGNGCAAASCGGKDGGMAGNGCAAASCGGKDGGMARNGCAAASCGGKDGGVAGNGCVAENGGKTEIHGGAGISDTAMGCEAGSGGDTSGLDGGAGSGGDAENNYMAKSEPRAGAGSGSDAENRPCGGAGSGSDTSGLDGVSESGSDAENNYMAKSEPRAGAGSGSDAKNRPCGGAIADFYILLNSDVETPAGWCEPLIEMLDAHPDVAAVAPKLLAWTERSHAALSSGPLHSGSDAGHSPTVPSSGPLHSEPDAGHSPTVPSYGPLPAVVSSRSEPSPSGPVHSTPDAEYEHTAHRPGSSRPPVSQAGHSHAATPTGSSVSQAEFLHTRGAAESLDTDLPLFEYAGASGGFIDALGYPFCRGRILGTVERDHGQYDDAREVFWATGACFACRADVFHALGGFDEEFFAHQEEIDLCWRMQLTGRRIMVEPRSHVFHLGAGTLPPSAKKLYYNYRNNLAMLYKNLPDSTMRFVVFLRIMLNNLSACVYLVRGERANFRAVMDAHRDFGAMKRSYLREARKKIQTGRSTSPQEIYHGSIILRYLFGRCRFGKLI